jgi:hypothetical protein
MDFRPFTQQVEDCRRRWNRQTFRYVLTMARIVRNARDAAENHRQWNQWIRLQLRMDPSTVQRYLRIEGLAARNADSNPHFRKLTISKLDALSRLPVEKARELIGNGSSERMSDLEFLNLVRRLIHRKPNKSSLVNLTRSMDAAVHRVEASIRKWKDSGLVIPPEHKARIRRQLHPLSETLHRMELRAAAM